MKSHLKFTDLLVADSLSESDMLPRYEYSGALSSPEVIRERIRQWEGKFARAQSVATVKNVRSDWQVFFRWCIDRYRAALPTSTEVLLGFLNDQVASGKKRSTINRYLYTIRLINESAGLPDPTVHPDWRLEWKGVVRALAEHGNNAASQAEPLQATDIKRILSHMDELPQRPVVLRDAAMIALASDTLCRESELVAVQLEDFRRTWAEDEVRWSLHVPRSKTDQQGIGMYRYVDLATKARIDAWCAAAGISGGHIFLPLAGRPKGKSNKRIHLNPREFARIVRKRATEAGIERGWMMSGHSARVGSAVDLSEAAATVSEIAHAGGWQSERMVRRYTKESMAGQNAMARLRRK